MDYLIREAGEVSISVGERASSSKEMMQPRRKEALTNCDGHVKGVVTLLDTIGGKVDGGRVGWKGTSCLVPGDGYGDVVVVHCCLTFARADLVVGALDGLIV
jgi:hypothetical protein